MNISDDQGSKRFFENLYPANAPWDIGRPQPELVKLFTQFPPAGPVLEVGCGAGDLAIYLAASGLSVKAIDFAVGAIEIGKTKARSLDPRVADRLEFMVADAFDLSKVGGHFASIMDSGFFHLFDSGARDRFVHEVKKVLKHKGRYYLLGFAIDSPIPNAPKQITETEIRSRFSKEGGWHILAVHSSEFVTRSHRGNIPAVIACIERQE
jgi:ubiquinone/menaquinone biosynthesis C-methylase UbiE